MEAMLVVLSELIPIARLHIEHEYLKKADVSFPKEAFNTIIPD